MQLITCLLISYPLGSLFVRLPSVGLKHVFSIFVILFYFLGILHMFNGLLQLLLDILVTYYLAKGMRDKRMPWLVFMHVLPVFQPETPAHEPHSFTLGHLFIK